MKKITFLSLLFVFLFINAQGQFSKYVVQFTDKATTPFSINNPSAFLSAKAIERRNKQNISIDETDLPVSPGYVDSVRLAGNVIILNQSKWLNQVCIETQDSSALSKIRRFSFVKNSNPVKRVSKPGFISKNKFTEQINKVANPLSPLNPTGEYSYGNSFNQIKIHDGQYLHNAGFHGEGMLIAIIDAGFFHYQNLPAFDSANFNNQILDTYDFVANKVNVNEENPHGMQCFSIIAANIPGQLVGSCPKANFLLYRSEDVSSESPVEEQYWIAAAEKADSMGADIITTSLGYNTFDNPTFDYTYKDMDGHTTMIAKASSLAAKKGMILLAAAGNEGADSWHYITTPGDADNIITVGAINSSGTPAPFSSFGPSADGRVKPTVASVGVATAISSVNGNIVSGNGTSFATPNMAGLVTCLWQAFPEFTNLEIIDAVKKSSNNYSSPDDRTGYGIPNFKTAYQLLNTERIRRNVITILGDKRIKIFPNPFSKRITVLINPETSGKAFLTLYDVAGKLYLSKEISLLQNQPQQISLENLQAVQGCIYILKFFDGKNNQSFKLVAK